MALDDLLVRSAGDRCCDNPQAGLSPTSSSKLMLGVPTTICLSQPPVL
jgi:hypothetical protein